MSNFKSKCRCCTMETESNKLTNLYTKIDNTINIAEILETCTDLIILPTDQRPQQICQMCRLDLWKAYSFRKKCQHSEILFQFQLPDVENVDCNNLTMVVKNELIDVDVSSSEPNFNDTFEVATSSPASDICDELLETSTINDDRNISIDNPSKQEIEFNEFRQIQSINIEPAIKTDWRHKVVKKMKNTFCSKDQRQSLCQTNRTATAMDKSLTCDICLHKTKSKTAMIYHMRIHANVKPFCCTICGKSFRQKGTLNTHLTLHTGKTHLCQLCGKRFSRKSYLEIHVRTHTGHLPYSCSDCMVQFAQKCELTIHRERHHNNGNKPFGCKFCDKMFSSRATLRSHFVVHKGYPYKCIMCEKSFAKRKFLQKHLSQNHLIAVHLNDLHAYSSDTMLYEILDESIDNSNLEKSLDEYEIEYLEQ